MSPGNIARNDLTGKTLGRWQITGPAMSLGTGARWHCRCVDCGHELAALGTALRRIRVGCPGCRAQDNFPAGW